MRKLIYLAILIIVSAVSANAGSIVLNWTYVQGGDTATGFNVYRSTDGATYTKLTGSPLSIGTLTYTDSTPVASTYYYYVIKAVDGSAVESLASNQIAAQGPANPPANPVAPSKLVIMFP
jgi:rhamnogalacturonan endolyase